jgi:GNAT superfamily N-acetyltransferase
MPRPGLSIHPLTPDRWDDLVALFGPNGATGGCWCMYNRQTNAEYEAGKGEANKQSFSAIVAEGRVPGLLASLDGAPVGWVSIAPREEYARLQRSPVMKPVDDTPVWSITCFVIDRRHRGEGVASSLLDAAVDYARSRGAVAVEGYPVEPRKESMPAVFAWMGFASMFEKSGFVEIARRSETRPLMRKNLG